MHLIPGGSFGLHLFDQHGDPVAFVFQQPGTIHPANAEAERAFAAELCRCWNAFHGDDDRRITEDSDADAR